MSSYWLNATKYIRREWRKNWIVYYFRFKCLLCVVRKTSYNKNF